MKINILKSWISICFCAMMYKRTKKPNDWLDKISFIFIIYSFFFISTIINNIILYCCGIGKDKYNRLLIYCLYVIIAYITYEFTNKPVKKIILLYDPSKYYKKNNNYDFLCIILFLLSLIFSFLFFIFSHKIQNYI